VLHPSAAESHAPNQNGGYLRLINAVVRRVQPHFVTVPGIRASTSKPAEGTVRFGLDGTDH